MTQTTPTAQNPTNTATSIDFQGDRVADPMSDASDFEDALTNFHRGRSRGARAQHRDGRHQGGRPVPQSAHGRPTVALLHRIYTTTITPAPMNPRPSTSTAAATYSICSAGQTCALRAYTSRRTTIWTCHASKFPRKRRGSPSPQESTQEGSSRRPFPRRRVS